jgi:hypothetical protein
MTLTKIKYQHWDSDGEWVDFPEFIKFSQLPFNHQNGHFNAWVVKRTAVTKFTPDGRVADCEVMREVK